MLTTALVCRVITPAAARKAFSVLRFCNDLFSVHAHPFTCGLLLASPFWGCGAALGARRAAIGGLGCGFWEAFRIFNANKLSTLSIRSRLARPLMRVQEGAAPLDSPEHHDYC